MEPRPRGSYRSRLAWEEIRVPYFMNKPTTGTDGQISEAALGKGKGSWKVSVSSWVGRPGSEQEWARTQEDKEAGKDKEAGGQWEK